MASNFQGLSNTKRHTRANGINAGGINSGAYCPGVLSMVLMKVCLGFFVGSLCVTGSYARFGVFPLQMLEWKLFSFVGERRRLDASDCSVGNRSIVFS